MNKQESRKKNYCVICKYYGIFHEDSKELTHAKLYDDGSSISVTLCRHHDVDLFRNGQRSFLIGHGKILTMNVVEEDDDFARMMAKTIKNSDQTFF